MTIKGYYNWWSTQAPFYGSAVAGAATQVAARIPVLQVATVPMMIAGPIITGGVMGYMLSQEDVFTDVLKGVAGYNIGGVSSDMVLTAVGM